MMKKLRYYTILFALLAFNSLAFAERNVEGADGRPRFNPTEFRAKLERHITAKASLTESEAQKFFPIYFEMKDKQLDIMKQINKLKYCKPGCNATEKDFSNAIQKAKELNVKQAELEETYYKRLCKAVSPKKVYEAMLAEDEFHRNMLKNFNSHPRKR